MKTTNYEISRQLAEAGFKGEHDFSWYKKKSGKKLLNYSRCGTVIFQNSKDRILDYYEFCFPAYDLETILEALPKRIDINGVGCRFEMYSFADLDRNELISIGYMRTRNFTVLSSKNESLADTAAKMWLKLKKENLI